MKAYNVINTRIPRVDAGAKATGEARYAADLSHAEHALRGRSFRVLSPMRRYSISIPPQAKKLPGVRDIVTAKEAPP